MPGLNDRLRQIQCKAEQPVQAMPYVEILKAIHETRYTGEYRVHCKDGEPRRFKFGDGLCVDVAK